MSGSQLPLFQRKTYKGIIPTIPVEIQAPGADKTVLETLPAYYTYLSSGGFSKYTPDDFTGDVKKFGVYCKEKKIQEVTDRDIASWIAFLKTPSPRGEGLRAKTVSRKLTCGAQLLYLLAVKGFSRLRPHDGMAHTGLDIRPQSRHNWTEI
jgi:site-specific recombinase XerC